MNLRIYETQLFEILKYFVGMFYKKNDGRIDAINWGPQFYPCLPVFLITF